MAEPTAVNSQISDAVTQSNTEVLGSAPAHAMGALYQTIAQAAGNAALNATDTQQASQSVSQAIVTRCVERLLGSSAK